MKTALVVLNPVSGDGGALKLYEEMLSAPDAARSLAEACGAGLNISDWPVVRTTAEDKWKGELSKALTAGQIAAVVVIGGDGTLSAAASCLHESGRGKDVLFVPLPGGRGNDFVRGIHGYRREDGEFWRWAAGEKVRDAEISRHGKGWTRSALDLAIAWTGDAVSEKDPHSIDRSNGRVFLNMASLGYGGRIVETSQIRHAPWSKTPMVYQVEGALALFGSGQDRCSVSVDGVAAYDGPFFGAFVGNGKANGNGLYWTGQANISDGLVDSIVFERPGMIEMARALSAVKKQKPATFRHKAEFKGASVVFQFDVAQPLELDGDFAGRALVHGFSCLPGALRTLAVKI